MKIWKKRLIWGVSSFLFIYLAAVSLAIADNGGWEIWRVLLAGWPFAGIIGCIAASFPFEDD